MSEPQMFTMPAVFVGTDRLSIVAQDETKRLVGLELWLAVAAALSGVLSWDVKGHDVFALLGTIAFGVALVLTLVRLLKRPEDEWYLGRAQAESVKTLAWRYAVCGDPFPDGLSAAEADAALLARLEEVVKFLGDRGLKAVPGDARQLPESMKATRAMNLTERRRVYLEHRISHQANWYGTKSERAGELARRWAWTAGGAAAVGFLAGLSRFVGAFDEDLLGVLAAVFGSVIAWSQLNQYTTLETSYAVAQQELLLIRDRLQAVPDERWSTFVSDAEDAISREHSMWLARRGHPSITNGRGT